MLLEATLNITMAAKFLIVATILNVIGMGLLVYQARLNLATARRLTEITKLQCGERP